MKISFQPGWNESSVSIAKRYSKYCLNDQSSWKNIEFSSSNPDTIIAIQNPLLYSEFSIHFRREPDIIKKWPSSIFGENIFDYSSKEKFHVATWWLNKSYDQLSKLYFTKKSLISAVCSKKYPWRYEYINSVINLNPKVIGKGEPFDEMINLEDRTNLYLNSCATLCIENSCQNNYFTEKFIDPILAWCLPIYWGCPNISDFFPEGSYRLIDINNPDSATEMISKPITSYEIDALHEARNLILNKYNIWECIFQTVNK